MNQHILAIDIGTTSTKGLLVASDCHVVFSHQVYYATQYPQAGFAEQDPEEILSAVQKVIRLIIEQLPASISLTGICLSSAMHSIMAVDANGKPLTNLIIWADTRSAEQATSLKNTELGIKLHQETGLPIHPLSPLCKLLWLRENDWTTFTYANKFISVKEYVIWHLTGKYLVDFSIAAASGLFNHVTMQWHIDALKIVGIDESKLSELVSPTEHIPLSNFTKTQLRLPDIPLIPGASDGCLAQLGSHAMSEKDLTITIGTSGAVRRVTKSGISNIDPRLFYYPLDEKNFISGGASNNGTAIIDWFDAQLNKNSERLAGFTADIENIPVGSEGLIILPYLQGERAPIYNPSARGVFFGVSMNHTRQHFKRALLEGICFEIKSIVDVVEAVYGPSERILVSGGFTHSSLWVQMLADVLGRELIQADTNDASALGAAMMGFRSVNIITQQSIRPLNYIRPDLNRHNLYSPIYNKFQILYKQVEELF